MADNGLIKGQGLVLVTGKKGSGKSHFVTSQIKYIVDNHPDHKVFADIDGLSIDGVEPSPADWQDAPKNCTIIYDEAQRLPWADNSSTKINSDVRVREMTMIRHENKNIVLITQDPMFIHSALRKLVDTHYHISHPFRDGKPKVFKFAGAMGTIDDKGVYKQHALETFTHYLDADTSKLYKSVDDDAKHDQKKKIPKKIIYMVIFIACLILIGIPAGIWGVSKVFGFMSSAQERSDETAKQLSNNVDTITGDSTNTTTFDAVAQQEMMNQQLKELEQKYLNQYTIDVANYDTVRPASIMAKHGKCRAYNKFGDGLNISNDECLAMLDDPATIPHPRTVSQQPQPNNIDTSKDFDYISAQS